MATLDADLQRVAAALQRARRLLFITGAGLSADSGLPTYRGVGGIYQDRCTAEGYPIEVALSGEMFAQRPEITWKYLKEVERGCRGAQPNAAHRVIAELERRLEVCVLTQNVDGLHAQAGSADPIEIHGNLHRLRCQACGATRTLPNDGQLIWPSRCQACGGSERPDVVLFGELLPEAALARYYAALERGFDLVFSVGTSSIFPYIAAPVAAARQLGWLTVEINPGTTAISAEVDIKLAVGAAEGLSTLFQLAFGPPPEA